MKNLNEFQIERIMRNLLIDWVEFSIEGEGSDHIHLAEKPT